MPFKLFKKLTISSVVTSATVNCATLASRTVFILPKRVLPYLRSVARLTRVVIAMDRYGGLLGGFLRAVPPVQKPLSLTDGNKFREGIMSEVGKYVSTLVDPRNMMLDSFHHLKHNKSLQGSFLVHAGTVSDQEVCGTPMFCYKDGLSNPEIDRLLTPISLTRLTVPNNENSDVFRIGNIIYSEDSGLFDIIPTLRTRLMERNLHEGLVFVGPLIKNINSSFVNKITTAIKGDTVLNESLSHGLVLKLPVEQFMDFETTNTFHYTGRLPMTHRSYIYYALGYVITADGTQSLLQKFFRTPIEGPEFTRLVRDYFAGEIRNFFLGDNDFGQGNFLMFGAVCRCGYFPEDSLLTRTRVSIKGGGLSLIEIPDFTVSRGPWQFI
ncbi:assembly/DNA maturation [Murine herpesvirus strain 4556]|uniref:Assembly/DNA maturation n=1 Tax=Murine herpesvirus TaxID=1431748 RepID=A0A6M4EH58_9BETA|nr:assembly/DNA maturation [Murine herpesvirus]UNZ86768.1 assembly/DNA maturation [Murine herpesvirus strain 4556]